MQPIHSCRVSTHAILYALFSNPSLDQGQGGAVAIEDAVALTVVLPLGTKPSDVPERLKLYEQFRYERANKIQEYTRVAGRDRTEPGSVDSESS